MTDKPGGRSAQTDVTWPAGTPRNEAAELALARFAKIGFGALRKPFDPGTGPAAGRAEGLHEDGTPEDQGRELKEWQDGRRLLITMGLGAYGTDYMKRAVVAAFGWPANPQEDAVYPYTMVDGKARRRPAPPTSTPTFAKGHAYNAGPSSKAYDRPGWWFVPEWLNKFTVSLRNNLKINPGSITLYFPDRIAGRQGIELAWRRRASTILMLRMYCWWTRHRRSSTAAGRRAEGSQLTTT